MSVSSTLAAAPAVALAAVLGAPAPAAAAGVPPPTFTDATLEAKLVARHAPLDGFDPVAGGAVGDFDNDGHIDVFFPSGGGEPDRLFINEGDGTFAERAAEWGVAQRHRGTGAAAGDYDGDGRLDLFVTSLGPVEGPLPGKHRLYKNIDGHVFIDAAGPAGVAFTSTGAADGWSAAWGDLDLDGDLDLAVAGRLTFDGNRVFRNDGDGTFTDVTDELGLAEPLGGVDGFTPRFADLDGDRWPELVWIGDFGTSRYLVNEGGLSFLDLTGPSGQGHDFSEMGSTVADFDGDGDFDVYVTTIGTNNLYVNFGGHVFVDFGDWAGAGEAGWGWGTAATDFDHDGRLDILVASQSGRQFAFRNVTIPGNLPAFVEVGAAIGFDVPVSARGLATFDYDDDGDEDALLFVRRGPLMLLRNDLSGPGAGWLRVFLHRRGEKGIAPGGMGSVVRARVGAEWLARRIDGGSNYLSQGEGSAHFGLGAAAVVDELRVEWTSGAVTSLAGLPANARITVFPPTALRPGDLDGSGTVGLNDLATLLGWWGPCPPPAPPPAPPSGCPPDLDGDGGVGLADLVILLAGW